jgi:predicted transcriptional regulator
LKINLADREAQFMEILWEYGPATVTEVRQRLQDDLAYTTVLTILRNLEAKAYVRHEEQGRAHVYSAAIERQAAQRSALKAITAKFFKGSHALLLAHLVSDETLTDAEIKRIRELINGRSGRGKP